MSINDEFKVQASGDLEELLLGINDDCFPRCGDLPYRDRYLNIKRVLRPIQEDVVACALAESAQDGSHRLVYLNDHGPAHVDMVIKRATLLLRCFKMHHLKAYELFMLCCAIQLHDVGNVFGREGHERKIVQISQQYCSDYFNNPAEKKYIDSIALAHGGRVGINDKDTIGKLNALTTCSGVSIRPRLLAAILRLSDEIADDSSRADDIALSMGILPESSQIYHYYSRALHTVQLAYNNDNGFNTIELHFAFDSDIAQKEFNVGEDIRKHLQDEIYDRSLKMERERRYCNCFMRPCLSIDRIEVNIFVWHTRNPYATDEIKYVLTDSGYPLIPEDGCIGNIIQGIRSGEDTLRKLIDEGGEL